MDAGSFDSQAVKERADWGLSGDSWAGKRLRATLSGQGRSVTGGEGQDE